MAECQIKVKPELNELTPQATLIRSYGHNRYCKPLKYGVNIIQRNYGTALESVLLV